MKIEMTEYIVITTIGRKGFIFELLKVDELCFIYQKKIKRL